MIIPVKYDNGGYDIIVERGACKRIAEYIPCETRALVVTDDGVPSEYAASVASAFQDATVFTIPQGEPSKNLDNFRALLSKMLELSFTRFDCVIAVGGGVVGDLAGFAASAYMRGIDFYNIPTTLLSQLDSSIGGKVAVDLDGVKNAVGAFYNPKRVIIDPDVLATLDKRQISAGLAEAIKMAATLNKSLFEFIEKSEDLLRDIDTIINGSLCIKRDVVEKDPKEIDLRRVLNFGHTIGHAIESYMGGKWMHGECVALGMLFMCSPDVRKRLCAVLEKYDLPTSCKANESELASYIAHDKKAVCGGVCAVFVEEIGSYEFRKLSIEEIKKYMEERA